MGSRWETYTLQVAMNNVNFVKVFQSLNGVSELGGTQQTTDECGIAAYQLQVIASVIADVFHDVPIGHPFGDHREPPFLEGVRNTDEVEDVFMRQVLPHGDFFAEVLYRV